jgi:hypothetical protein
VTGTLKDLCSNIVMCFACLHFPPFTLKKSKEIRKLTLFFLVKMEIQKYLNTIETENIFTADVMPE